MAVKKMEVEVMPDKKLKLGSLFDGIGGFPLVGSWYGIEPVWASEIEPAPIRITSRHFLNMKHLGDITKIKGYEVEPVDVITGGSPCQDMSVAGKQEGIKLKCESCKTLVSFKNFGEIKKCPECGAELESTRSGLFMEQMRIIREMRKNTNECYPKIVVWENVPGALSSNNGDDFFCVIQEFCKLMGERISSFRPEKWTNAGGILGESCSIAWRVLDAQYWGVPQRRRRIFLVADFTGQCAGEILFKSESLRRHITPSTVPWKRFTIKTEKSIGATSADNQNGLKPICAAAKQANAEIMFDKCPTLTEANGTSGSNKPYVVPNNKIDTYDINSTIEEPVYCIQGNCIDRADTAGCSGKGWMEDVSFTLTTVDRPAVAYGVSENMSGFVWTTKERVNALTTGGGKPGQGFGCVFIEDKYTKSTESDEKLYVAAFAHQQGSKMPSLPYGEDISPTLIRGQTMAVLIENHSQDCRWTEAKDNICPTLTSAMGTGGNNTPLCT